MDNYFYNQSLPNDDDYIIVKIININENGFECELLEYNNIKGYVNVYDITTNKIKNISDLKKYGKEDKIDIMQVKNIDDTVINLNMKYLDNTQKQKNLQKYKFIINILNILKINDLKINEDVYEYFTNINKIIQEIQFENTEIFNFVKNIFSKNINTLKDNYKEILLDKLFKNENDKACKIKIVNLYKNAPNLINQIINIEDIKCDKDLYILNLKKLEFKYNSIEIKLDTEDEIKTHFLKFNNQHEKTFSTETETETETNFIAEQPILNLGIIGHVSHGKTTTIKRLSGIDTKRYKKEMETQRTIKLGYTNCYIIKCVCELNSGDSNSGEIKFKSQNKKSCKCDSVYISIIDTPGHHAFMNTMLTGVNIMDTALLIVAADEKCPQPQTYEHLMGITINYLEKQNYLNNGLILQNKIDLVSKEKAIENQKEIQEFLKNTPLEDNIILPISAEKNIGMGKLNEWIFNFAKEKLRRENKNELKSDKITTGIIVRTFDTNKPGENINNLKGIVLGCSIINGTLHIGDEIIIYPYNIKTKVYSLKTDDYNLNTAKRGGLIGVRTNLLPTNDYTGCFFKKINPQDSSDNLNLPNLQINSIFVKYTLRKDIKIKLTCLNEIYINYLGKIIKCKIITVDKKLKTMKLELPENSLQLLPEFSNNILLCLLDFRLIGYAQIQNSYQNSSLSKVDKININCGEYINNLDYVYKKIKQSNSKKLQLQIYPEIFIEKNKSRIINYKELLSHVSQLTSLSENVIENYIKKELLNLNISINKVYDELYLKSEFKCNIRNVFVQILQKLIS